MALLEQLTLLELKEYDGRKRIYVPSSGVLTNLGNTITTTDFTISASSVQPLSGKTLNALPEGYRSKAQYQFWTKTEIYGLEQGTNQLSDQISIGGQWYSIYNLKDWTRTSFLAHYHCIAIREDTDNSWSYENSGGNFG